MVSGRARIPPRLLPSAPLLYIIRSQPVTDQRKVPPCNVGWMVILAVGIW